jgi:hypothetical protein
MKFEVDTTLWPVVTMRQMRQMGLTAGGEYDGLFKVLEQLYKRGESFILITDARGVTKMPNAQERKAISVRSEALQIQYGVRPFASVVIVDSSAARGTLTAMQWLTQRDLFAVSNMDEALEKAKRMLLHAGLELPPGLNSAS